MVLDEGHVALMRIRVKEGRWVMEKNRVAFQHDMLDCFISITIALLNDGKYVTSGRP
jgi:hypothetical protein